MADKTKYMGESNPTDLTKVTVKSAKNMAGYADDKEIDPKLLQVGELVREQVVKDLSNHGELMETCNPEEEKLEGKQEQNWENIQ